MQLPVFSLYNEATFGMYVLFLLVPSDLIKVTSTATFMVKVQAIYSVKSVGNQSGRLSV